MLDASKSKKTAFVDVGAFSSSPLDLSVVAFIMAITVDSVEEMRVESSRINLDLSRHCGRFDMVGVIFRNPNRASVRFFGLCAHGARPASEARPGNWNPQEPSRG
jgi:hypothetical protein